MTTSISTGNILASPPFMQGNVLLTDLIEPVKDDILIVEDWLKTNLIDNNSFIAELLAQIFQAGGKRIRPLIVLLCSRATYQSQPQSKRPFSRLHIILAVLTELIHTASLLHDDVIDNASLRRGKPTINHRFNDRVAVLMGDLLFAQASICLSRITNPSIVGIYGQVLGDLCAGELSQMKEQYSTQVDFQKYLNKSIAKTASLISAGSHSGAILNAQGNEIVLALKNYGMALGICFQIIDDLLDVTGASNNLGKEPGSDLLGGIITAPALFVLERGDKPALRLKQLIATRAISHLEGAQEALELIRENGGVEAAFDLATKYANESKNSLSLLSPSVYRDALVSLVDYVLTRAN